MKYPNYIYINTNILLNNIRNIKKELNYSYYILDVSNNAFNHGMYSIISLKEDIDYLYTTNFCDVKLIRKYNQEIPIIYNGDINEDNIYDLILNNVIFLIKSEEMLDTILNFKIKDKFDIILNIDINNLNGLYSKHQINDIMDMIEGKFQINILGVKAEITEKDYDNFRYIISPLKNMELVILNNERDLNKIKLSNAIMLDASIYGVNNIKKGLFTKKNYDINQVFSLYSKINRITIERKNRKETYLGVIPYGYKNGMLKDIKKVYINNKFYNIEDIKEDITIIKIDNTIKLEDLVEITGIHNPMDNFNLEYPLLYFSILNSNLPIVYDDYVMEKTYLY